MDSSKSSFPLLTADRPKSDNLLTSPPSERLVLPLWRSISSLNLMLPKEERRAMLLRLYNDETPLFDHTQARKAGVATSSTTSTNGATAEGAKEDIVLEDETAEPETLVDEDGGVKLNADILDDGDEDEAMVDVDATAPVGEAGVGTEAQGLETEDRLRAEQQVVADQDSRDAAAPERVGESDEFNRTV